MLVRVFKFFSSLRLTVVCLALAIALVFFGTWAQVDDGLYLAQSRWFRSFIVWWGPSGAGLKIPVFPGGYLIGSVLLVNLIAAHIKRFQFTWKKAGINITHFGVILLLGGQLATDMLSREMQVQFVPGETKGYSESARQNELVFLTDAADPKQDEVVSIPESIVKNEGEIRNPSLPFTVRVKEYHINADIRTRGPMVDKDPPLATNGFGPRVVMTPEPETRKMDERNMPSAVLELIGPQGTVGTWLVSTLFMNEPQSFSIGDKIWRVALRFQRQYLPYSIKLLSVKHDVYPGTDIPKDYQSRVRIENPARGENREVDIYMNNPLRYQGVTYYQSQMSGEEINGRPDSSVLQAVHNPSWLTPYVGCILVGGGMVTQFLMHLVGFISKRRKA